MKTLRPFFYVLLLTFFISGCSNKDNEFYNEITLKVPNLVTIDTQSSYAQNDILWMHTAFSQYLVEENQTDLLDVYQTSGQAPSFMFIFSLEKQQTNGTWVFYPLTSNLLVDQGVANEYDGYCTGYCLYNATTKTFDFKTGLKLTESGNYRLNFGYESLATRAVTLRSTSIATNLFVNIQSSVTALDSGGFYSFTVN
jgi:hypothetical protein